MTINSSPKDHTACLLQATKTNDLEAVADILSDQPSLLLYESFPKERNLLLLAARAGSIDVVRWLLFHHGKDTLLIDSQDRYGSLCALSVHLSACFLLFQPPPPAHQNT